MGESSREVVVLTGASAGVGRAIALEFARQGVAIALLARGSERLQSAAREVEEVGGKALPISVDVAEADEVSEAGRRAEAELGPIDVWVNCAMVTMFSPIGQLSPREFRRITEVTYLGTVYGTMTALEHMRPRDRGTIVQVGSALAYRAIPLQSGYCGAKFAIRGFTDAVRSELIHDHSKVHMTMVQLAAFNTPQFDWARTVFDKPPQPLPPIFQPEEAARAVNWAAHHKRRELWVGFPAVKAIIGTMIAPGYGDRLTAKQAYSGQMDSTAPPVSPDRKDNLFETVPGNFGAHGRFDDRSRERSLQFKLSKNRGAVWSGSLIVVLILVILIGMAL